MENLAARRKAHTGRDSAADDAYGLLGSYDGGLNASHVARAATALWNASTACSAGAQGSARPLKKDFDRTQCTPTAAAPTAWHFLCFYRFEFGVRCHEGPGVHRGVAVCIPGSSGRPALVPVGFSGCHDGTDELGPVNTELFSARAGVACADLQWCATGRSMNNVASGALGHAVPQDLRAEAREAERLQRAATSLLSESPCCSVRPLRKPFANHPRPYVEALVVVQLACLLDTHSKANAPAQRRPRR